MKITIDTKEDSVKEIKKVINFLNAFIEGNEIVSNRDIFEQQDLSRENVLGNLFDANKEQKPKQKEKSKEEKKKEPEIQVIY